MSDKNTNEAQNKPYKRKWGDRRDGRLIRDLDAMHTITPLIYPNRCDNEAYISERIDLEAINNYLAKINQTETEFPYTIFHVVTTALVKTITLRPKMNRFIANRNMYERNEVTAAFVVKKQFSDSAGEGLAFVHTKGNDTLQTIHQSIKEQVLICRSNVPDKSTQQMDSYIKKLPRWLLRLVVDVVRVLDKHGKCPKSFIETDPYYSSVLLSNLGSIKLKCGYHHLTNWGTTSFFCVIGEKKKTPHFDQETGQYTMRETLDLGLTVDERIADGYYFSKTVRLIKHLLQNPELLEKPLDEEVDY